MVRLRRQVGAGPNGVAALVPATLFLPQVSTQGGPFSGYARIMRRGRGAVIGEVGDRSRGEAGPNLSPASNRTNSVLTSKLLTARARIAARTRRPQMDRGFVGAGIIMVCLCGVRRADPRRAPRNPSPEIEQALDAGEVRSLTISRSSTSASGQLCGAEVLQCAGASRTASLVSPGAFIPLMESGGLIPPRLTRNLMQKVCVEAGPTIGRRPDLKISF